MLVAVCHLWKSSVIKSLLLKNQQIVNACLSIYLILAAPLGLGVYSASDKNKYQQQK
jgi:hypothetical protein